MGVDGRCLRLARERLAAERAAREDALDRRREELFRREPRLREIETALRMTVTGILSTALREGADPEAAVGRIQRENLRLQEERRLLLGAMGEREDALAYRPACALCGDTGFIAGKGLCACLTRLCAEEQKKRLSRLLRMDGQSFSSFDTEKYSGEWDADMGISPRECAERTKKACEAFARSLGTGCENLLLFGEPGLGKTHLSAAIARVATENGHSVVYDTAGHIFELLERRKFNRESEEDREDVEGIFGAELLIVDDLGTEMPSELARAALYRIVNTRLTERKSTVINTNLRPDEWKERYGAATASRLTGEYRLCPLIGEDLRGRK